MDRRKFTKLGISAGLCALFPNLSFAKRLDLSAVDFEPSVYENFKAQTILVFLYGGPSQLAGNLTNIDAIKRASQNDYDRYFDAVTPTPNGFWREAGGAEMEKLIADGDMTVFRCCFSEEREKNGNKAHARCIAENQRGSYDLDSAGLLSNLGHILYNKNALNDDTLMPFVTMEGESKFYAQGAQESASILRPVGIDGDLDNPYKRNTRRYHLYTEEELDRLPDKWWDESTPGVFDPQLDQIFETLANNRYTHTKIKNAFAKRATLSRFIDTIRTQEIPDLADASYPQDDPFAQKLQTAVKLLSHNPDTKVITVGTDSLGGWDDHSDAESYVSRSERLFRALRSAMAHIKAIGKEDSINIMVFGEFGRNVNLNSALGWDHGNLQNFYVLGGKGYFNHQGVVGETVLENTGQVNRLYLKPKEGTYRFDPMSIASTLFSIYGIANPETLTGYKPIDKLLR